MHRPSKPQKRSTRVRRYSKALLGEPRPGFILSFLQGLLWWDFPGISPPGRHPGTNQEIPKPPQLASLEAPTEHPATLQRELVTHMYLLSYPFSMTQSL